MGVAQAGPPLVDDEAVPHLHQALGVRVDQDRPALRVQEDHAGGQPVDHLGHRPGLVLHPREAPEDLVGALEVGKEQVSERASSSPRGSLPWYR